VLACIGSSMLLVVPALGDDSSLTPRSNVTPAPGLSHLPVVLGENAALITTLSRWTSTRHGHSRSTVSLAWPSQRKVVTPFGALFDPVSIPP
jgi:hypothetical protein